VVASVVEMSVVEPTTLAEPTVGSSVVVGGGVDVEPGADELDIGCSVAVGNDPVPTPSSPQPTTHASAPTSPTPRHLLASIFSASDCTVPRSRAAGVGLQWRNAARAEPRGCSPVSAPLHRQRCSSWSTATFWALTSSQSSTR
jgi:hypothetical protein